MEGIYFSTQGHAANQCEGHKRKTEIFLMKIQNFKIPVNYNKQKHIITKIINR
jgi:hypothetical protein